MILCLDSSALVKLLVDEDRSHAVRDIVREAEILACSRVTLAEVAAALARAEREGVLDREALAKAIEAMETMWLDLFKVGVNERRAAQLALTHVIRGFDAIHLAAALDCRDASGEGEVRFLTFDRRQAQAAAAEGF